MLGDLENPLPRLAGSASRQEAVVLYSSSDTNKTANVCRCVRHRDSRIAVLISGARGDRRDECVAALEAGADDYLVSPGADELIARIRSITRRHAERAGRRSANSKHRSAGEKAPHKAERAHGF